MKRKTTVIASILAAGTLAGYAQNSDVASPSQDTRGAEVPGETIADAATNAMEMPQSLFDFRRLQGIEVQGADGENIADIEKLLIDETGQIHYAVLGTGGFLDLGERLIAVPWDTLTVTEESAISDYSGVEIDSDADVTADAEADAAAKSSDNANMPKNLANNDGDAADVEADSDAVAEADTETDVDIEPGNDVVDPSESQVNREPETRLVVRIDATREQLANAPEFKDEDVKMLLSDASSNKVTEFWNNPTAEPETQGAE